MPVRAPREADLRADPPQPAVPEAHARRSPRRRAVHEVGHAPLLADIAQRCADAGVTPGIYAGEPELARRMLALGFRFMPVASDGSLLALSARRTVSPSAALSAPAHAQEQAILVGDVIATPW